MQRLCAHEVLYEPGIEKKWKCWHWLPSISSCNNSGWLCSRGSSSRICFQRKMKTAIVSWPLPTVNCKLTALKLYAHSVHNVLLSARWQIKALGGALQAMSLYHHPMHCSETHCTGGGHHLKTNPGIAALSWSVLVRSDGATNQTSKKSNVVQLYPLRPNGGSH